MCYIPMVADIVPVVNIAENYILLEPPEGLLDLAVAKQERVVVRGLLTAGSDSSSASSDSDSS
jgi:hypothetical protein